MAGVFRQGAEQFLGRGNDLHRPIVRRLRAKVAPQIAELPAGRFEDQDGDLHEKRPFRFSYEASTLPPLDQFVRPIAFG